MRITRRRAIALLLSVSMVFTLVGCGSDKKKDDTDHYVINYEGSVNVPANSDTKWINSSIYGMIDESLQISEKDDFYTAVNKDWILEQEAPTREVDGVGMLMEGTDIVKERLIDIVSGTSNPDEMDGTQVALDLNEVAHDQELVTQFVMAAADWDARNAAGVEPIRPYIESVEAISSMEDMTAFMLDTKGMNISQENLLSMGTLAGAVDAMAYRIMVAPSGVYALNTTTAYTDMNFKEHHAMNLNDNVVKLVLSQLGYEDAKIDQILKNCYKLEGMLVDHTNINMMNSLDSYKKSYTLEEIAKLSGAYPFEQVYTSLGYDETDDIRLGDPDYMKYLGRIYNTSNLELLKSYYIVHIIGTQILFLDRELFDLASEIDDVNAGIVDRDTSGDGDVNETEIKDDWDLILNKYAMTYMAGPMDVVYIAKYCSEEQKQEIEELVAQIIDHYHDMIDAETWMTDSAKQATKEKLDYITVHAVYPDKLQSYETLQFTEDDNLLTMVQKIHTYQNEQQVLRAGEPVDKEDWDLAETPTVTVNAYYKPTENSINILAGIISGENVFNVDAPDEVNLARIGTVIGHEISHAFDSSGCYYDKYGERNNWWDVNELTTFQLRVNDMSNYYNAYAPYPGAKNLTGRNLTGEAIADMGGMGVTLRIAKDIPDFDYDLYFRSYAELWRTSRSLGMEQYCAENDAHPINNLRTNVTVMQFDEFIDCYDIKPGDGMYCDPEDRIKVW